jgi:hypothetical protein
VNELRQLTHDRPRAPQTPPSLSSGALVRVVVAALAHQTDSPTSKLVGVCAYERIKSAGCKSPPRFGLNLVTEGNCVLVKGGGEQLEVKDQSVGDELDSACRCGEPAP